MSDSDDERPAKRTSRQRKQTARALESSASSAKCDLILSGVAAVAAGKDVAKGRNARGDASDVDEDYRSGDDSDDIDFGKRASVASKRRKGSAVLQSIAFKNIQQRQLAPHHAPQPVPTLDADFRPLADLKGVDVSAVVGRRIRCWYESSAEQAAGGGGGAAAATAGEGPTLQASVGVVTYYGVEGRLHAVYDGEEECKRCAREKGHFQRRTRPWHARSPARTGTLHGCACASILSPLQPPTAPPTPMFTLPSHISPSTSLPLPCLAPP